MKHIKKTLSYSIAGSLGLTVIAGLQGCGNSSQPPQGPVTGVEENQQQSFFMVIEQTGTNPDTYKLVEKHPTNGPTRAILRDQNGNERFLSKEELQKIADQEAAKVEAGTSRLTQDPSMHSGGMSLGETLLAAAAGSLLGSMLANQLLGNKNFQKSQQRYGGGRPTASISRPHTKSTAGAKKPTSSFFGSKSSTSRSSGTSFRSFGG